MRSLITLLCICLLACAPEKRSLELHTIEQQKLFLENMYDRDQEVRNTDQPPGQMNNVDRENLKQIETYLREYGHPNIKDHGNKASGTPSLIIHHSNVKGIRKKHFPMIYKAYKEGNINEGALSFYMNRWHRIRYGHMIDWNGPFTIDREIDTLFQRLEIDYVDR